MCFHAHVKAEQEVVEIKSYAKAVGGCQLLVERIEMKHSARLRFIVVYCPDVAGINEDSKLHHPE